MDAGSLRALIGGSDDHGARSPRGHIGSPATIIYARELSEQALLDGIRSGRVYVRTRGPEGPRLELSAAAKEAIVPMGGIVKVAAAGTEVRLTVHVAGAAAEGAELVRNGTVISTQAVDSVDQELSFTLTLLPGQWVHVLLRDAQGITAFTNPIYAR